MRVLTYSRVNGGLTLLDDSLATVFLKESALGGALVTCASNDVNRIVAHPQTRKLVAFRTVSALIGGILSTATGTVITLPVGNYHVDRSIESGRGYPDLTFYRLTLAPITGPTFKDLFLYEGESARYRVYSVGAGNALTLAFTYDVTQVSYGAGTGPATLTNTGYSSTAENIIDTLVIRAGVNTIGLNITSGYKFLIRNLIYIGSGDALHTTAGGVQLRVLNSLFLGVKPGAGNANASVGRAFYGDYMGYYQFDGNTVRGMGGSSVGAYRNTDSARSGYERGNLYWDINRRRVDASGNYIKADWSSYHEDGNNRGFTKLSECNPVEPVGQDICFTFNLNNTPNPPDGFSSQVVGGWLSEANLTVGTPGRASMNDNKNVYRASGVTIRASCVFNNPSYDFNHTVDLAVWNMGQIKTNGTGNGPAYQSMSGNLASDSTPNTGDVPAQRRFYADVGSGNVLVDCWSIGMGATQSIQAGHGNSIVRPRVLASRLSPDGYSYASITADTHNTPAITRYDGGALAVDNGLPFWGGNFITGLRGIVPDCFNVGPTNAGTSTYPFGMDVKDLDLAQSTDNIMTKRDATIPEMWQGYADYLAFCAGLGYTRLGCVPA